MINLKKSKRVLELAIAFWIGIGLMSLINVWKVTQNQNAVSYSWIMFGFSVIFVIICVLFLVRGSAVKRK